MHSQYLLGLLTCTVVLSTVTFYLSSKVTPSAQDMEKQFQDAINDAYTNCGKKDRSQFCVRGGPASAASSWAVNFSLIIPGLLIFDQGRLQEVPVIQRFFKRFFVRFESLPKSEPRTEFKHSPLQRALRDRTAQNHMNGPSNLLNLIIWTWYAILLVYFQSDLGSLSPAGGWTFGQVVAIAVWAAPV